MCPFLPHEFATRASYLRQLDYAALPITKATLEDLDSVERQRIRQAIERYHGDRALLDLRDDALDGALGLTCTVGGKHVPTVAGLLLIGKEEALRTHIPSHEVALQKLENSLSVSMIFIVGHSYDSMSTSISSIEAA